MHFEIFLPGFLPRGDDGPNLSDDARRRGVADLLGNHDVRPLSEGTGPGGFSGLLVGWLSPQNPRLEYRPERQTWTPSVMREDDGSPLYYVGTWNDSPPTEQELRRSYTQEGPLVQFGAHKWILPLPTTVDSRAVYNDDGSMRWEPIRQFSWVCDEAKLMADRYLGPSFGLKSLTFQEDPAEQIGWLLKLLRINYRLLPELAVELELWTRKRHILDTVLLTLGLVRKGDES